MCFSPRSSGEMIWKCLLSCALTDRPAVRGGEHRSVPRELSRRGLCDVPHASPAVRHEERSGGNVRGEPLQAFQGSRQQLPPAFVTRVRVKPADVSCRWLFQESEPISNFLGQDVPDEVKRRVARMGVDTLLKMVSVEQGSSNHALRGRRKRLVLHPPFTWESGVKAVWPICSANPVVSN